MYVGCKDLCFFKIDTTVSGMKGWGEGQAKSLAKLELIEFFRDGLKEVKTIGGSAEYGKDGAMDPFERKQVKYFSVL